MDLFDDFFFLNIPEAFLQDDTENGTVKIIWFLAKKKVSIS